MASAVSAASVVLEVSAASGVGEGFGGFRGLEGVWKLWRPWRFRQIIGEMDSNESPKPGPPPKPSIFGL